MKQLAIFASGAGSNFEAIAKACACGQLKARVALLVCDKPQAQVVAKAAAYGIEAFVASPKEFDSKAAYEQAILRRLREHSIDLICLAGYMRIVSEVLLEPYEGRIINIHPSLLPAFKGANAVEQALAYGVKVFGITVHWVDATLDGGRIIAQRAFEYNGNDANEVHRLGQAIEHTLYVEVIKQIIEQNE